MSSDPRHGLAADHDTQIYIFKIMHIFSMPMLSRRAFLAGSAAFGLSGTAHAQAVLTDDGVYTEPWFLESFLELADDLAAASAKGKRLAIMWELRGCPYCKETHLVNFARPEIADYIKARFE